MARSPDEGGEPAMLRERLQRQHLAAAHPGDAAAVVRAFGAVQAQDYGAAAWAVGRRATGVDAASVDAALAEGSIIRTHILRPTWHFVAREDMRWLIALSGPRVLATTATRQAQLGIDAAMVARAEAAVTAALRGGALTRPELRRVFAGDAGLTVDDDRQRVPWLLLVLELRGVLCSGPHAGKQFTWALLEERVPETPVPSRDECLAELTRRYFAARGPASLKDFAWWSGLTVTDCRKAVTIAAGALREIPAGGTLISASASPAAAAEPAALTLLPAFDEYTVAYADRSALLAHPEARPGLTSFDLLGPVLVDREGRVAGTWRRTATKAGVTVEPTFFGTPTAEEEDALAHEAERYRAFW